MDETATSRTAIETTAGEEARGATRRGVLQCMAWAGTGLLWTVAGGVPVASVLTASAQAAEMAKDAKGFRFIQISDTHIGFNKDANPDVAGTAKAAIDIVNANAANTALVIHTGDKHPMRLQCDIKATTKRVDSQLIGTPKPPQSHPNATSRPGKSQISYAAKTGSPPVPSQPSGSPAA